MKISEWATIGADTAFLGVIGGGCVKSVKSAATAFLSSKYTYFVQAPSFFQNLLSLNAVTLGVVCSLFALVDLVAKKTLDKLCSEHANKPTFTIGRISSSVLLTSCSASCLGLAPSVGVAATTIGISLIVYTVVQCLAKTYNWARYKEIPLAITGKI